VAANQHLAVVAASDWRANSKSAWRGVAAVTHPAPQIRFPGHGQHRALQGGGDVAAASGLEAAGAEQPHGRAQLRLGHFDVLRGLFNHGGGDAQVGIVGDGLADQRIELRVAERGEPVVVDAAGRPAGLPGGWQGDIGQGLAPDFGRGRRRLGPAAGEQGDAQHGGGDELVK